MSAISLSGCIDSPPRNANGGASCNKSWGGTLCPPANQRCETDSNGCERCTCDTATPEAPPGPERR